ncbi:MAG: ferredoxin [Candidatus Micrarchaeota archaeon]
MAIEVIHDKGTCIGCGACVAVCPKHWEMGDDGKSHLKSSKEKEKNFFHLDLNEMDGNLEAAQSCPVTCIHINENGNKKI